MEAWLSRSYKVETLAPSHIMSEESATASEIITQGAAKEAGNGLRVKTQRVKNFRKLLRRKQSSAKISKISRNTLRSRESAIFYLLKYLLRSFQKFLPFAFLPSGSF